MKQLFVRDVVELPRKPMIKCTCCDDYNCYESVIYSYNQAIDEISALPVKIEVDVEKIRTVIIDTLYRCFEQYPDVYRGRETIVAQAIADNISDIIKKMYE